MNDRSWVGLVESIIIRRGECTKAQYPMVSNGKKGNTKREAERAGKRNEGKRQGEEG